MIAAGPGVVFEFGEEAPQQDAGRVGGIDPVAGEQLVGERLAELLEVQAEQQQVVLRRTDRRGGGRRWPARARRRQAGAGGSGGG